MYCSIFCCRPLFGRGFFLLHASCLRFSAFVRSLCLWRLSYPLVVLNYFVIRVILFDIVFSASFLLLKIVGPYNRSQWFVLDCSIHSSGSSGNIIRSSRGRLAVVRIHFLFVVLVFVPLIFVFVSCFFPVLFLPWTSWFRVSQTSTIFLRKRSTIAAP